MKGRGQLASVGGSNFRDVEVLFDVQTVHQCLNRAIEESAQRALGEHWTQFFRDLRANVTTQYLNVFRKEELSGAKLQAAKTFEIEGVQRIEPLTKEKLPLSRRASQVLTGAPALENFEIYVVRSLTQKDLVEFERQLVLEQRDSVELLRKHRIRVQLNFIVLNYQDWMFSSLDTAGRVRDYETLDVSCWRVVDDDKFRKNSRLIAKHNIRQHTCLKLLVKSQQDLVNLSFSRSEVRLRSRR